MLKWVQFREGKGCWGCSTWPACDYKEAATERLATPQVTLEAVSKELFKVDALPMLLRDAYPTNKVPLSATKCPAVPFKASDSPVPFGALYTLTLLALQLAFHNALGTSCHLSRFCNSICAAGSTLL